MEEKDVYTKEEALTNNLAKKGCLAIVVGMIWAFVAPAIGMLLWNNGVMQTLGITQLETIPYWTMFWIMFIVHSIISKTKYDVGYVKDLDSSSASILYSVIWLVVMVGEIVIFTWAYNGMIRTYFNNLIELPYLTCGQMFGIVWLFRLVFKLFEIETLSEADMESSLRLALMKDKD